MKIFTHKVTNPKKWVLWLLSKKIARLVPDKTYLSLKYWARLGKSINWENPKTFNEKLQWLKLHDRNPKYTQMVDKYEIRKYIAETIGEKYLIPLIGVWGKFEDIDFDKLPEQFVLKCTHDSGGLVICKDKRKFDIEAARLKINRCLKRNYYWVHREWPYKNVKPRIICEEYMVDESGTELKDYKVFCFNGKPKLIQVDYNRFKGHKRNLYDTSWNYLKASINYPTDSSVRIKKPEKLNEMLEIAQKLSKNYPHIRIDFYNINEKIFFGEMTFYHGSGFGDFEPKEFEIEMGNWIELPVK